MTCSFEGCGRLHAARGLCGPHYHQRYLRGQELRPLKPWAPPVERFWSFVRKQDAGCWEWTGLIHSGGYGALKVRGQRIRAHRYSWELHNGPVPEGLWVLHHCDNRLCVRPGHLFLGTSAENMADMVRKGRSANPARPLVPCDRLTWSDVVDIRSLVGLVSLETLARAYGCCKGNIRWAAECPDAGVEVRGSAEVEEGGVR